MSQAFDTEIAADYTNYVAPVVTNLPQPLYREREDTNNVLYTGFVPSAWRDEIAYPLGMLNQPTGVKVHEHGHCFAQHLGRWYPGGWAQARHDWLVYHGAPLSLVTTHEAALWECFAEHFTAGLISNYDYVGYPQYRGLVPFRSSADTRYWLVQANSRSEAYGMARMQPRTIAVTVDTNGDTPKPAGQFVSSVAGLIPGLDAQGICTRVGFVGSETEIGHFVFETDTPTQAYGRLHVRGAKGGGTIYVRVSAFQ